MDPIESDATTRVRPSGRLTRRGVIILALLVAVVAAGAGGLALARGLAGTTGTPKAGNGRFPVVTLYDAKTSREPQSTPTAGLPQPCNCEAHSQTRANPPTPPPAPSQLIVVSLSQQWLWAYQGGQQVFDTPVTTGQPGLETPTGTFDIQQKLWDIMFYSPWPQGSPYYYSPEHIDFAMLFLSGGYFIHDATWRHCFGPGTNVPHTCPDGTQETGSHGCVNVPYSAGQWLINWVRMGTTVRIEA